MQGVSAVSAGGNPKPKLVGEEAQIEKGRWQYVQRPPRLTWLAAGWRPD